MLIHFPGAQLMCRKPVNAPQSPSLVTSRSRGVLESYLIGTKSALQKSYSVYGGYTRCLPLDPVCASAIAVRMLQDPHTHKPREVWNLLVKFCRVPVFSPRLCPAYMKSHYTPTFTTAIMQTSTLGFNNFQKVGTSRLKLG
jgi:hypothetical protein